MEATPVWRTNNVLDATQTALGFAGFVPVLSTPASLLDAGISGARGQYLDAALSSLGALPVLGTIGKIGQQVPDALRYLSDILRPGGKLIGEAGSRPEIRRLAGDQKAAEDLFIDLGKGGDIIRDHPKDPTGLEILLPGAGHLGLRQSKTGPAIDITQQAEI